MRIGTSSKVLLALTLLGGAAAAQPWLPGGAKPVSVIDISRSRGEVISTFSQGLSQGVRPGDRAFFVDRSNPNARLFEGLVVKGVSPTTAWVALPYSQENWTLANGAGKRYELRVVPGGTCAGSGAPPPSGAALTSGNAEWGAAGVELGPFEKEAPGWLKADGTLRAGFREGVIPRGRALVVVDGMVLGAARLTLHRVTQTSADFDVTHIPESLANKGIRVVFAKAKCQ